MQSIRKTKYISLVIILLMWCVPALAEIMPEKCCCCIETQCSCGCEAKKAASKDAFEKKEMAEGTSGCECYINKGTDTSKNDIVLQASQKHGVEVAKQTILGTFNYHKGKSNLVFQNKSFDISCQTTFLLNASFLL